MSFAEAVCSCFAGYARFDGRARRSEFWYWLLFRAIVSVGATMLDVVLHLRWSHPVLTTTYHSGPIELAVIVLLFVPTLAVGVRRLHDTDRSGWWALLCLMCGVLIIVFGVQDSQPGANRYGANPKGVEPWSHGLDPWPGTDPGSFGS